MTALVIGTMLALLALAFVLAPLFADDQLGSGETRPPRELVTPRRRAVDALREIEFDRATGKLSDADYDALKARYTQEAVAAMRAEERAALEGAPVADADVEATIRRFRRRIECPLHGLRPEGDALYCSACGRYLPAVCERCGAEIDEPGAAFCSACGAALAA